MRRRMRSVLNISLALFRFQLKGKHLCFNSANVRTSVYRSLTQWNLLSAVCLERKPVITQELTSFEKQYSDYLQQLELQKSHLSDHELQHIEDVKIAEKLKSGESDLAVKQTAQDFEDMCIKELSTFEPASRVTNADLDNNKKSVNRRLDQTLIFVVKQKLGNDYHWILPQAAHFEGETLRQTADRAVKETYGDNIKVQLQGNAPVGFYKYKYPRAISQNGTCGAKVFFFKAILMRRNLCSKFLENNPNINDYLWLLHSELKHVLKPAYHKSVEAFLLSEEIEAENEKDIEKEADKVKKAVTN